MTTRRRLRSELRRLRDARGLSQGDVARELDWSLSKVIRIENGTVGVSVTDVRALLTVYEAKAEAIDDVVALARAARERRWWNSYRQYLSPQYQEFIGFEDEATRLLQFHPTIVPGLLQTEAYIRALIPHLVLTEIANDELDALVRVRLTRQKLLVGESPTEFSVVIDEAALRRQVGGPEVMRAQLKHIADMQERSWVSIAVLPFSAGPHMGMQGAFHIMEFADDAEGDVLYLENALGDVAMRDQPELLSQYRYQLDKMTKMSLRGAAVVDFLDQLAKELR